MEGQDVVYILTPRIIINENYLMQGHHLKYNTASKLVYFFTGYTNEIPLPNLELCLYKSPALTFALVPQEEARKNYVSGSLTRIRARHKAGSSKQS
jgi:hypothetical protein